MGLKRIAVALLTALLLGVIAGGIGSAKTFDVVLTSGTARGTWYPVSALLADILQKEISGLRVTVTEGGGAVNPGRVNQGTDFNMGYTYADTFMNAIRGVGEFNKPLSNLRAMLATSVTNYSIIVPADSSIREVEDLVGKRFAVSLPGEGPELMSQKVLDAYGLSYDAVKKAGGKIVFTGTAEMSGLMKDGHVDAIAAMGPIRHSIGMELEAWKPMRVLSLRPEKISEFQKKWPGFIEVEIPAGTYSGQKSAARTMGSVVVMICHKDLPEDLVYKITKAVIENGEIINKQYVDYSISLENALRGVDQEYFHLGALKYIKEALEAKKKK